MGMVGLLIAIGAVWGITYGYGRWYRYAQRRNSDPTSTVDIVPLIPSVLATFATIVAAIIAAGSGYFQTLINQQAQIDLAQKSAEYIPRSRQYPKILWIDHAEVVGDGITKASPVLGDFVAQEIERGVRELSACGVAFVVRYIPVHETP